MVVNSAADVQEVFVPSQLQKHPHSAFVNVLTPIAKRYFSGLCERLGDILSTSRSKRQKLAHWTANREL